MMLRGCYEETASVEFQLQPPPSATRSRRRHAITIDRSTATTPDAIQYPLLSDDFLINTFFHSRRQMYRKIKVQKELPTKQHYRERYKSSKRRQSGR